MNFIIPNGEFANYSIEFKKEKNVFSYNQFINYSCSMIFKNSLGLPVLEIKGNEKEFYELLNSVYSIMLYYGEILSDNIYFSYSSSNLNHFLINIEPRAEEYINSEGEEDEKFYVRFRISQYNYNMNNYILRFNFELEYESVDYLCYCLYDLLSDISYINMYDMSELNGYNTFPELRNLKYY